jgi:hypothetical protein
MHNERSADLKAVARDKAATKPQARDGLITVSYHDTTPFRAHTTYIHGKITRIVNNPTLAEIPEWNSLKQPMFSLKIITEGRKLSSCHSLRYKRWRPSTRLRIKAQSPAQLHAIRRGFRCHTRGAGSEQGDSAPSNEARCSTSKPQARSKTTLG